MASAAPSDNPYRFHRLALLPLLPGAPETDFTGTQGHLRGIDLTLFAAFLEGQGLAPLWDELLKTGNGAQALPPYFRQTLRQARLNATAAYLVQKHRLGEARETLDSRGIPHAVYKGADLRERLYPDPALRPAEDIDLLVGDHQKRAAIEAFTRNGFDLYSDGDNVSHEVTLGKGKTEIDLHWDILRPGRTRVPMAPLLLAMREDFRSHWGLRDEAALFIALVHPVFARYSTQATLVRMLDLAALLSRERLDRELVVQLLQRSGLKTAAWITLAWYEYLSRRQAPAELAAPVRPGTLKRRYLRHWLRQNYSSRFERRPAYVHLGFTLPAHDSWRDGIRVLRRVRELRRSRQADRDYLSGQSAS